MIAAQQYYIDYGPDMILERLQSLLPSYIPDSCLQGGKSLNYWMQGVVNGHKKSYFVRDRVPPLKVRSFISRYFVKVAVLKHEAILAFISFFIILGERRHSQLCKIQMATIVLSLL